MCQKKKLCNTVDKDEMKGALVTGKKTFCCLSQLQPKLSELSNYKLQAFYYVCIGTDTK